MVYVVLSLSTIQGEFFSQINKTDHPFDPCHVVLSPPVNHTHCNYYFHTTECTIKSALDVYFQSQRLQHAFCLPMMAKNVSSPLTCPHSSMYRHTNRVCCEAVSIPYNSLTIIRISVCDTQSVSCTLINCMYPNIYVLYYVHPILSHNMYLWFMSFTV